MALLKDFSVSAVIAGFVCVLVGFTSSAVIVFQAAHAIGATEAQVASWMWALGIGIGVTSIGLSLRYRIPVVTAWSTPGAALLITSSSGITMPEAIGAFIVCSALTVLVGFTGWFERAMRRLPMALAAAMLAGILLRFGLDAFASLIALPLFIVTMASQNTPGVATMRASGYHPKVSPLIGWTGAAALVLAPFGAFTVNLAAITAAICMGREAHEDSSKRYVAALASGVFYIVIALFGAAVVAVFAAFPRELVMAIAGLALIGTIGNALTQALHDERSREAALITFLVTASGVSLAGVGAPFWGLVAGALVLAVQTVSGTRLRALWAGAK